MAIKIGDEIHLLTVERLVRTVRVGKHYYHYYECRCRCGNLKTIKAHDIGRCTKSCGCLRKCNRGPRVRPESRIGCEYGSFVVTKYLGRRHVPSGLFHEYEIACKHCGVTKSCAVSNLNMLKTCKCERVFDQLTEYEQQVLSMRETLSTADIAEALGKSVHAIRTTSLNARRKAGISTARKKGEPRPPKLIKPTHQLTEHEQKLRTMRKTMTLGDIAMALGIRRDTVKKTLQNIRRKIALARLSNPHREGLAGRPPGGTGG